MIDARNVGCILIGITEPHNKQSIHQRDLAVGERGGGAVAPYLEVCTCLARPLKHHPPGELDALLAAVTIHQLEDCHRLRETDSQQWPGLVNPFRNGTHLSDKLLRISVE